MGKATSKLSQRLGRFVKGLVGVLLILPVVGLAGGIYRHLESIPAGTRSCAPWFLWGLIGYAGVHILLYRPKWLFKLNHALLERLAIWLFGGQVATVGGEGAAGKPSKGKSKKSKEAKEAGEPSQGSTLVIISPYLVPLYVVLVAVVWWLSTRGTADASLNGIVSLLIGVGLGFHLAMTGEDLQHRTEQIPIETRIMTLSISGMASLLITSVCLPLALPAFSATTVFADATATMGTLYATIVRTLFF